MHSPEPQDAESVVRESMRVEIAAPWAPDDRLIMALDVYQARVRRDGVLLFCVPGGGVNRKYYDMKRDAPGAVSFAMDMAARGHVVLAIDPPGVGDSTRPENGFRLTADAVAACLHAAFHAILAQRPDLAQRPLVGVGHSAGSMLLTIQQAGWRDFAALILTCFGPSGKADQFSEAELAALARPDRGRSRLEELTRQHFNDQAYIDIAMRPFGSGGGEPLRRVLDKVLTLVAMQAMTPGNVEPEMAQIDVPIMLAIGERDMTGPPHLIPAAFTACPDLYLHVVPASGHHIFLAAAARQFYERAAGWLRDFAKGQG